MADKKSDANLKQGKKLKEEYEYSSYESDESPVRKPLPKLKQKKEPSQKELGSKSEKHQHRQPAPVETEYSSFEDSEGSPMPTKEQTDGIDEPKDASRRRTTRRRSRAKRGATRSRSRRGRRSSRSRSRR